jgi:hypothetical protein
MLMPAPPSRDSRATSSLRIDQQPATTKRASNQVGQTDEHQLSRDGAAVACDEQLLTGGVRVPVKGAF